MNFYSILYSFPPFYNSTFSLFSFLLFQWKIIISICFHRHAIFVLHQCYEVGIIIAVLERVKWGPKEVIQGCTEINCEAANQTQALDLILFPTPYAISISIPAVSFSFLCISKASIGTHYSKIHGSQHSEHQNCPGSFYESWWLPALSPTRDPNAQLRLRMNRSCLHFY